MRFGLMLAVIAQTAATAEAGPTWNYTITYGPANGADYTFGGVIWEYDRNNYDPVTHIPYKLEYALLSESRSWWNGGSNSYTGTAAGSMVSVEVGGATGYRNFVGFSPGTPVPLDALPNYSYDDEWAIRFDITEAASGESGTVELRSRPVLNGRWPMRLWEEYYWAGHRAEGSDSVVLGGYRFTPNLGRYWSESWNVLTAGVDVAPAVETPEPASLILAAVGIAGCALRRRASVG